MKNRWRNSSQHIGIQEVKFHIHIAGRGQKGSSVFESISNSKTETSWDEHRKGSRSTLRVSADLETFPQDPLSCLVQPGKLILNQCEK